MDITPQRINEAIKKSGGSIRGVAKVADIPQSTLQRYASGKNDVPIDKLKAIAKATGVTAAYLLGWDSVSQQPEPALVIPPILNDVQVAFSGGAGDGLEQADIDALVTIAERMKKYRDENKDHRAWEAAKSRKKPAH